jgi:outer membrane protein, heavy metal efflux system
VWWFVDFVVAGAPAPRPAAATLPDPRLAAGIENLPMAGPDRWSATRDSGTMQRLALMQEVPNRAKREARQQVAEARVERERATRAVTALTVKREAALAWLGVYHAERRLALLAELRRENQLLQDTLPARIAGGQSQPGDLTMARQEALTIADRGDELARDVRRARAELRRWVGVRADDPLVGPPLLPGVAAETVRGGLHRHAELLAYGPMRDMANAEMAEADAEKRGDWAWEVAYSRRPRYDDMVSFQLSFDLPWQRDRRQQPAVEGKRQEALRIEAEREEALRRHAAEVDAMLADAAALEAQLARLQGTGLALSEERVRLATASYQAGRGDLGAVLAARTQAVDVRLRAIELEAQHDAVRVRLTTLIAE